MSSPPHLPRSRRDVPRRWAGALGLALAAAALLAAIAPASVRWVGRPFPGFLFWDNGTLVALHDSDWTGVRADLPLNGGVLRSVDGAPFAGGRALVAHAAQRPPGTPIRYEVETREALRQVVVPTMRLEMHDWLLTFGSYLFASTAFFAVGVVALALRPDQPAARALAIATASMGALLALSIDFMSSYRFVGATRFAEALVPAALLHFALLFPVERLSPRRRAALLTGAGLALGVAAAIAARAFHSRPQVADSISLGLYAVMAATGLALLGSLCQAVVRARDPVRRLQAAVVLVGALAAFGLPAVAVLAFSLLGWEFSWGWLALLLPLFPASVLYAIVRHDLLGAERLVRVTLGWTVATAAVVLGYAGAVALVERLLFPGAATRPAANFGLLLAIALSFEPLRRRVQAGVDRTLFRSRVDPGRVLEETSAELAAGAGVDAIARDVARRLAEGLALEWAELAPEGEAPAAPARDAAVLEPVCFGGESLGVLRGGPKRSGAPFSAVERDVVRGLAAQAAVAIHNARALDELRRTQQALLRSARLAAVGEFAGSVAHGIRNPLAGIRAAAQLAHRQAPAGALRESLAGVLGEADRLEQRIRTLLDFSRPHEPRLRDADLAETLRAVARAMAPHARGCGVAIELELGAAPLAARCDPDYLEEALLELAGNALRAMSGGGVLRLGGHREGGAVVLTVTDTGPGIPEGLRERVFELFFTTRPDGTGLGLATVKKIVESHGGRVAVAYTGARGTQMRIELPGRTRPA